MNSLVAIKEIKFIIYKFSEICKTNFMREFQQMFEDNIHTSSAQFRPENGKETLPNWFYEAITMTLKPDKIKCKKKKENFKPVSLMNIDSKYYQIELSKIKELYIMNIWSLSRDSGLVWYSRIHQYNPP